MNILLNDNDVINYYTNHNVKSTLKEFDITYSELKRICSRNNFYKTPEQIKETYKTTRIEKYGSIEGYREAKDKAFNNTILKKYGSKEFYNGIKSNNSRKEEE